MAHSLLEEVGGCTVPQAPEMVSYSRKQSLFLKPTGGCGLI